MMKSWYTTIKVNQKSTIVFDLDDTLYKEIDFLKSAYTEIAQSLESNAWQLLFIKMFSLYRNGKNVFEYLADNYGIGIDELLKRYRTHMPDIKPAMGALNLIKGIKENEGKVAIITDGRSETQRNKIRALGLFDQIDAILISEETGYAKPSIENFKTLEERYLGHNFTYIADNIKKDFIAPNLLNWDSIYLLDNGMNIHVTPLEYLNEGQLSKNFVTSLEHIKILEV